MTEKIQKSRKLGMEASCLAACALHGVVPEIPDVNLETLYRFCKFHNITSIVAMALEEAWKLQPGDPEIMKKWRQARDKAIRKNIMLNAERERIFAHLESIGCWHLPLKGSLLQFDYPKFGMRQMSDNDILYDESKAQEVHEFLLSDGYETENFLQGNHDEYVKKPVYNVEMHRSLFMASVNPVLARYYENVKEKLIKDEGNSFGYHFSHEDFYIFLVAHGYKHYVHGGVGIRNLMDTYVFMSKYGQSLDWEYVERELRSFGAWDFDVECRNLAEKLFSDPNAKVQLTTPEQSALDLYFTSGAFGTAQRAVENRLNEVSGERSGGGKLRYVLKRLFPSLEYMKDMYPALRKRAWLAPVFYLRRLASVLFERRKAVAQELNNLRNTKK